MPESVLAPQLDIMALQSGPGMSPPPPDSPPPSSKSPRDSNWLQVEVCRDFRRDTCPRGDQCRFAHPEAKIIGRDGTVTCCYDFLKVSLGIERQRWSEVSYVWDPMLSCREDASEISASTITHLTTSRRG